MPPEQGTPPQQGDIRVNGLFSLRSLFS